MARRFQSFGYHSLRELEAETATYMSQKKMIKIPSTLVYLLRWRRCRPFSDIAIWKIERRQRDEEDIHTGRRTPEQVGQDDSWLMPPGL